MILKKKISRYGTGAHVVLPKAKLGEDVLIIYDDDLQNFKDTVRNAYLIDSIKDQRLIKIEDEIKNNIQTRLAVIERLLTSLKLGLSSSDSQSNGHSKESQSSPFSTVVSDFGSKDIQDDSSQ